MATCFELDDGNKEEVLADIQQDGQPRLIYVRGCNIEWFA